MNKIEFEWDSKKQGKNFKKHQIDFWEAKTVFDDPYALTFYDDLHSIHEDREITIGFSSAARLLLVCHTERAGKIRIISARNVDRDEKKHYEKKYKKSKF